MNAALLYYILTSSEKRGKLPPVTFSKFDKWLLSKPSYLQVIISLLLGCVIGLISVTLSAVLSKILC